MINRRKLIGLLLVVCCGASVSALAQEAFKEGVHYELLKNKAPTTVGEGKIEVVEIFWYGCPHCFSLEPNVEKWLETKPENVEFVRVPGVGGRWSLGAATYYTALKLGKLDDLHLAVFDAIHVKKQKMNTVDEVAELFAEHGVDRAAFDKAMNSFEVKTNMQRSQELMRRYQVTGVPALIVNGQYKTNAFDVVDYLVRKESGSS